MAEDDQYAGEVIQAGMRNAHWSRAVEIRTALRGLHLIMEDGAALV